VIRHCSRLALAALLCIVSAPASSQTAPPSGNAAIEWLRRNLGGAACVAFEAGPSPLQMDRIEENTEVQFDGCRMVLQQAAVTGSRSELRTYAVLLSTLEASSVTVREGYLLPPGWSSRGDVPTHAIVLTVPEGQPAIESRTETFDGAAPTTVSMRAMDLLVRTPDGATQLVDALKLAIATCRSSDQAN
jgi:hypothetical protein